MAEQPSAASYEKFFKSLRESRGTFNSLMDECRHYFLPNRPSFVGQLPEGEDRYDELYTSQPALARQQLATAVGHTLRPGDRNWIRPIPRSARLREDAESLAWCREAQSVAYSLIYDPRSRFEEKASEVDDDTVAFGQGILYQNFDPANGYIIYRSRPLSSTYFMQGVTGITDQVHCLYPMSLREFVQAFGEEALSDKRRRQWQATGDRSKTEAKGRCEVVHAVMPQQIAKRFNLPPTKHRFASYWIDLEEKKVVRSGGYKRFPYVIPRWDTVSEEALARSPAMIALADAKTANAIQRTLLEVGEVAARPPLIAAFEMIKGDVELYPGGVTYIDGQGLAYFQGKPIQAIDTGHQIPLTLEILQAVEQRIRDTFHLSMLLMPNNRDMTVDEVRARTEELVRFTGPIMQRLLSDYNVPIVEYAVYSAVEYGMLPEMPQQMAESGGMEVICEGPLTMARQRAAAYRSIESMQSILPLAEVQPQALEVVDWDRMVANIVMGLVDDSSLLKPLEEVKAMREQQQQMMQLQQGLEAAQAAGGAAKDLAAADQQSDGLLQSMLGGMTGA